jgi:hypothetical protein
LTVEFTRIPLSGRGEAACNSLRHRNATTSLDAGKFNEVTENAASVAGTP